MLSEQSLDMSCSSIKHAQSPHSAVCRCSIIFLNFAKLGGILRITYILKYTLNLFFIDNGKGLPHFKFAPLDYGYSGVFFQKYKVTGNPTLLVAPCFCLKFGMSKMIEIDLDL